VFRKTDDVARADFLSGDPASTINFQALELP